MLRKRLNLITLKFDLIERCVVQLDCENHPQYLTYDSFADTVPADFIRWGQCGDFVD